jgi:hypothetical protein
MNKKEVMEICKFLRDKKIKGFFFMPPDGGEVAWWDNMSVMHEAMNRLRIHMKWQDNLAMKSWFETFPTEKDSTKRDVEYIG